MWYKKFVLNEINVISKIYVGLMLRKRKALSGELKTKMYNNYILKIQQIAIAVRDLRCIYQLFMYWIKTIQDFILL